MSRQDAMYTDQELLWATQIAYCNATKEDIGHTLQEIFAEHGDKFYYDQKILTKTDGDKGIMAKEAKQFIADVAAGKICQGWKLVSIGDDQGKSGMFALTIETGENEAIVAFRGSESVDAEQFIKDWGLADFCLINGKATAQEEMAYQYLAEVGDALAYENLTLTGHSLGGNLSHVATVYAYERDQKLYSRIRQSVSFDGQGHPEEYIKEHKEAIDAMQDKLTHYQWSFVGTILTSFCQGDNYQMVLSDKFSSLALKHSTASLRFNEDGSLIKTEEKDEFASAIDTLTDCIDENLHVQLWASSLTHIIFYTLENCNELFKLLEENKVSGDKISNYMLSMIRFYYLDICWSKVSKNPVPVPSEAKQDLHRQYSEAKEQYIAAFEDLSKEIYDTYGPESDIFSAAMKTVGEFLQDYPDFRMNNDRITIDVIEWLVKMRMQEIRNQCKTYKDFMECSMKFTKDLLDYKLLNSKNAVDAMVSFGKMYIQAVGNSYEALKDVMKLMVALQDNGLLTRENVMDVLGLLGKIYIQEQSNPNEAIKEFIGFMKSMQDSGLLTGENVKDAIGSLAEALALGSLSRSKMFKNFMESLLEKFHSASAAAYVDPLVFDMDGDGFELLTKENGVYFDEDNVGLREKTEWVGADDALLAVDWNGDGVIGDGSELFGTSTLLRDGGTAKSGFEALAQFDDNGDGRIDAEDEIYSRLVLWQDKNGDGISQEDELYTLEQLGIESISLQQRAEDGVNVADVNFQDGTSGKIGEFIFDSDLYDTIDSDESEISEEIKALPNVRAMGSVESLHVLMQRDESGTLMTYVEEFEQSGTVEERWDIVQKILYFITGADKVKANSRGSYFDAQKLTVIERLMGQDFVGTGGRNPVNTAAPILEEVYRGLADMYYTALMADSYLKEYINMTFWTTDKAGKKYLDTSVLDMYLQYGGVDAEDAVKIVGEISRYIRVSNPDNRSNFEYYLAKYADKQEYVVSIVECTGLHMVLGTEESDEIHGSSSSKYSERDVIYGGDGNDKLYGEHGDDTLIGGAGDDYLSGGYGSDTYIYNRGDGNDTIDNFDPSESRENDRLVLGGGIRPEEIGIKRDGKNLVLTDTVTGQTVTVRNAFGNKVDYLENIVFEDGTVWGREYISSRLSVITGTEGADRLVGYSNDAYGYDGNESIYGGAGNDYLDGSYGNDVLYGGEGNDELYGSGGNDILVGGAGDDYLSGGAGSDTYLYNRGDGNDAIWNSDSSASCLNDRLLFGEGINPEEIRLTRQGDDMIVTDTVTGQKITVQDAFWGQWGYLYNVEFADGTVWTMEDMQEMLSVIRGGSDADTLKGAGKVRGYTNNETFYGGEGNDTIYGGSGNDMLYGEEDDDVLYGEDGDDVLVGGAGDDYLNGSYGSDTYLYNRGDGNDTIDNSDSSDTRENDRLVLGGGIRPEEISMKRAGSDLVLTDTVTNQTITIHDAFKNKSDFLENIVFEDGTVWNRETVEQKLSVSVGTEGNDEIHGLGQAYGCTGNDTIYGGEGNDKLYGEYGDDTLIGGAGDDYLCGSYGSDTYIYHRGDGNDTIENRDFSDTQANDRLVLGGGIRPEEIAMKRNGKNLVLTDTVTGQTITVRNAFGGNADYLENIVFEDGTVWGNEYISSRLSVITGTEGA
ncbi:MAG: DUF2974 domain-containing protein, partial [Acetatifactor sp.]|nr:DUF2974 domain-containing protein [Acetatifactor sp.]